MAGWMNEYIRSHSSTTLMCSPGVRLVMFNNIVGIMALFFRACMGIVSCAIDPATTVELFTPKSH